MEITYVVIVSIVTYILGAINKAFIKNMPNEFIPLQNIVIGLVSGFACYYFGVEADLLQSMVLCFLSAMGAGGVADVTLTAKKLKKQEDLQKWRCLWKIWNVSKTNLMTAMLCSPIVVTDKKRSTKNLQMMTKELNSLRKILTQSKTW